MKRIPTIALMAGLALILGAVPVMADSEAALYEVTITNITRGQIISPPVVFSHARGVELFRLGTPAGEALSKLAEDGMTAPLVGELTSTQGVYDVATATGGIAPGGSVTVEVTARGPFGYVSAAGMLVSTNDAFFAVVGLALPWWHGTTAREAEAYDAGSEANSESCAFIPGPPCGNGGVRDTSQAEGFVHVHAGIQGIGDLAPENMDWRNPVARVEIRRVK